MRKGELVVISRSGEAMIISDQHSRERERHKVPLWGDLAAASTADQQVKAGTRAGRLGIR
jgi:hypothetical protein